MGSLRNALPAYYASTNLECQSEVDQLHSRWGPLRKAAPAPAPPTTSCTTRAPALVVSIIVVSIIVVVVIGSAIEDTVLRLQITVHNAARVQVAQCSRDAPDDPSCVVLRVPPLLLGECCEQLAAFDQLRYDEVAIDMIAVVEIVLL